MGKRMGAQIKKARLDAGLTQEKLAQKVGGVTAQDISKAERGVLELETETIKKIAKVTGVARSSLLGNLHREEDRCRHGREKDDCDGQESNH